MRSDTRASVQRLLRELKVEIVRNGVSLVELDRELGRGRNYHSGLLRGRVDITAEHIYDILDVIGVEPGDFFGRLHPVNAEGSGADHADLLQSLSLKMATLMRQVGEVALQMEQIGRLRRPTGRR